MKSKTRDVECSKCGKVFPGRNEFPSNAAQLFAHTQECPKNALNKLQRELNERR